MTSHCALHELTLEITRECLNRCLHCSSMAVAHSATPPLSLSVLDALLHEAARLGLRSLSLSGGEPLLRPDLPHLLRATHHIPLENLFVYSSGIVRDSSGRAAPVSDLDLIAALRDAEARMVVNIQSIDPAIHDCIVGVEGRLGLTLQSLRQFIALGVHVECHVVPTRINLASLAATAHELIALGVERVSFLRLVPQGYAADHAEILCLNAQGKAELDRVFQELRLESDSDRRYRFGVPFSGRCSPVSTCHAGISKLIMRWDGTFFPCEAFKEAGRPEFILGRAGVTSLRDLLTAARTSAPLHLLRAQATGVDPCPAQCLYSR